MTRPRGLRWLPSLLLFCAPGAAGAAAPLSFQEAVQRALARNPSVLVAQADIRRVQGLLRQTRAASLPLLTAGLLYTRLDDDRRFADEVVAGKDQLSANLSLQAPLLAPQRWAQWVRAADDVQVTRMGLEDVRRQVVALTARVYLTVLGQRHLLTASERARDTAQAHLSYTRTRTRGGVGSRLDEVRAAQEVQTSEVRVRQAAAALASAREALGVAVGADGAIDAVENQRLPEGRPGGTIASRGDVRLFAVRAATARRAAKLSFTEFLPTAIGTFQPFYQDPPTLVQPRLGWQIQLVLSMPLYDGGLRYGRIQERRAVLTREEASYDGVVRQARAEVRAAEAALAEVEQGLAAAHEAARLAGESLKLTTLVYQAGGSGNLEVVDALRRSRDAETVVSLAENALWQARFDLQLASGAFP